LFHIIVLVSVIYHMNQPEVYICLLLPEAPSTCHSIPSLQVVTKHQVWVPWIIQQILTGYLFYLQECICFNATLSFWIEETLGLWKWHTNTDLTQYNTIQYHNIQCNTLQCNAIPYNTMQHDTTPCNTI